MVRHWSILVLAAAALAACLPSVYGADAQPNGLAVDVDETHNVEAWTGRDLLGMDMGGMQKEVNNDLVVVKGLEREMRGNIKKEILLKKLVWVKKKIVFLLLLKKKILHAKHIPHHVKKILLLKIKVVLRILFKIKRIILWKLKKLVKVCPKDCHGCRTLKKFKKVCVRKGWHRVCKRVIVKVHLKKVCKNYKCVLVKVPHCH